MECVLADAERLYGANDFPLTHTRIRAHRRPGQEAPTSDEVVSDVMSVMESALNELRALAS
jgi:hypothetical protein